MDELDAIFSCAHKGKGPWMALVKDMRSYDTLVLL